MFSSMSGKQDQHHFITSVITNDHKELYKQPHMLSLYANSFKQVNQSSKAFCSDIFSVQWREIEHSLRSAEQLDGAPAPIPTNKMQRNMLKYQQLANLQEDAQDCLANSMNLYLDSVSALTSRYAHCKSLCLEKNVELRKDLADMADEQKAGQRTRYFDPMTSDPCMSGCRAQFYFVFKRVNQYFTEESGFYIEQSKDYPVGGPSKVL